MGKAVEKLDSKWGETKGGCGLQGELWSRLLTQSLPALSQGGWAFVFQAFLGEMEIRGHFWLVMDLWKLSPVAFG